ncbi:ATP-grasp domain-containing protein [Kocuria sp.]|uniref:ATP-grasp domain-containing protein n=1 Tax=Kocuria sp. TaxID=1871328 RepID=UPI0026DF9259|nr:ATP-grasp domain-containing protein [Kocuria sp.]MDO5618528.1 ATP-grasp domain-containing protein [Kocuria sp.]
MAEPYLDAARRNGLQIAVVDTAGRLATLAERYPLIDQEVLPDGEAGHETGWVRPALALAARLAAGGERWGCLAFSEPHVLAAALVQDTYGIPGPGMRAALTSRNKALQRAQLDGIVDQPEHLLASSITDAAPWLQEHLPAVVKPLDGMGSHGVERVVAPSDIEDVVARRGVEGPVLCETYVEGQEYSVEALVVAGEPVLTNLTHKTTQDQKHFVEVAHRVGFEVVDPALAEVACGALRQVLSHLGVRDAMMSMEFRESGERVVVMETMVRMPGDHLMEAISRAYDRDLYAAHIQAALGIETPSLERFPHVRRPDQVGGRYGTCFLVAHRRGALQGIEWGELRTSAGVVRWGERFPPGHQVQPAESSADRVAYAIVRAADDAALSHLLDDLLDPARILINDQQEQKGLP